MDKLDVKQVGTFVVVALLAVVIIVFAVIMSAQANADKDKPMANLQKASVDVLKADLNLYYVDNGTYPVDEAELGKFVDSTAKSSTQYSDIEKNLNGVDYHVRGDEKAYKVSYKDIHQQPQSFTGEYAKDFN